MRSGRYVLGGILGGAAFLLFFFVFAKGNILLAFGVGIGAFIGASLLFAPGEEGYTVEMRTRGVTPEMLEEVVGKGRRTVREMRRMAKEVRDPNVRKKVMNIAETTEKIFDDFVKDPKDLKAGKQFVSYYLDATMKILSRYLDLSSHGTISADVRKTLEKAEGMLDTIKDAFDRQLARLLEDDVMDLDTEISVLEKTIKMEGLGGDNERR